MDAIVDFFGMIIRLVIFAVIVLVAIAVWGYNSLRRLAENVKESQSNIDVALRKKISLVNQLIDVANRYLDRESLIVMKVSADSTEAAMQQTYQQTGTVMATIQGMAQKFPEMKSNEQFNNLAASIEKTENEVQNYRVRCNAAIKEYNSKRSALPHALYASALGFKPARYLELEAVESPEAGVQKTVFSDDGDRLNELLGVASAKVIGGAKTVASQGRLMAEKAATRVQQEMAARSALPSAPAAEYHYLDASKTPKGPVSRSELDTLLRVGAITDDTDILQTGTNTWTKFSALRSTEAQS
jgi:LemA protein